MRSVDTSLNVENCRLGAPRRRTPGLLLVTALLLLALPFGRNTVADDEAVNVITPAGDAIVGRTVTVKGTLRGGQPSPDSILRVNGVDVAPTNGQFETTLTAQSDGPLKIRVVYGVPGRPAQVLERVVYVDMTPPSIDLCTPQGADLMAKLVTTNFYAEWEQNDGVIYTNGTINPNTRSEKVLLSAFYDLPANEVPNQPSERFVSSTYEASSISEEIARDLAERIVAETDTSGMSVWERLDNSFQFGSDWARVQPMQANKELARKGLNNNQRESLIRNTWGLFSPEDSLFTVVAVAQAIKEGPTGVGLWNPDDDLVTGERRAVALVWRDPFKTGKNLHHEMFIRMFRYLND